MQVEILILCLRFDSYLLLLNFYHKKVHIQGDSKLENAVLIMLGIIIIKNRHYNDNRLKISHDFPDNDVAWRYVMSTTWNLEYFETHYESIRWLH